jgi:hypothetical protein
MLNKGDGKQRLHAGLTIFDSREPHMRVALGKWPIRTYPKAWAKGAFNARASHNVALIQEP